MIDYMLYTCQNQETFIRIRQKRSGPIRCRQGIRQGDPLSVILFNPVIDEVLKHLDKHIGYRNEEGLPIDTLMEGLEYAGLHLNVSK